MITKIRENIALKLNFILEHTPPSDKLNYYSAVQRQTTATGSHPAVVDSLSPVYIYNVEIKG